MFNLLPLTFDGTSKEQLHLTKCLPFPRGLSDLLEFRNSLPKREFEVSKLKKAMVRCVGVR